MRTDDLWTIEWWSGLLAGILGLVLLGYALVAADHPLTRELGGGAAAMVVFFILLTVSVTAFLDSHVHQLWSAEVNLALLWTAALALWGFVLAVYPQIDVYLLPSAVLATVAAVAGSWADAQVRRWAG